MKEIYNKLIKGEKVDYELWVDKNKWEIYDSKDNVFIDFRNMLGNQGTGLSHVLRHNSGESMAIMQEAGITFVPLMTAELKNLVQCGVFYLQEPRLLLIKIA